MESPLQVDDPMALFRVHCPVCRQNVWAGLEPPPAEGDEMLAEHDCPGPVDITEEHPADIRTPMMLAPPPGQEQVKVTGVAVEPRTTTPSFEDPENH